jgi:hypothetical protein
MNIECSDLYMITPIGVAFVMFATSYNCVVPMETEF